jgi:hypothetical protein
MLLELTFRLSTVPQLVPVGRSRHQGLAETRPLDRASTTGNALVVWAVIVDGTV